MKGSEVIGLMEDLSGVRMPIVLETDSSALKGIAIWENPTWWVQGLGRANVGLYVGLFLYVVSL